MRQGRTPTEACRQAVERIIKNQPAKSKEIQVGFLAINKNGEHGAFALQKGFTYAVYSEEIPNKLFEAKSYY